MVLSQLKLKIKKLLSAPKFYKNWQNINYIIYTMYLLTRYIQSSNLIKFKTNYFVTKKIILYNSSCQVNNKVFRVNI